MGNRLGMKRVYNVVAVLLFAVVAVLGFPLNRDLRAQERGSTGRTGQVLALGVAKIVENNVASARQQAIARAVKKGVEYYLVSKLGQKTTAEHLDTLIDRILPRAKELVEYYHVVKETQLEDRYTLLLSIRVNEKLAIDRLREQGLLGTEAKPVRILFLVGNTLQGSGQYWWKRPEEISPLCPAELALFKAFQDKGFEFVDRTISFPTAEVTPEMKQVELSPLLIKAWGELFGANVVVYGKGQTESSGEVSMSLQVISVADGTEYCRMTETSFSTTKPSPQEIVSIFEEIVNRMMPRLEACVADAGGQELAYKTFEVVLRGLKDYVQYRRLKNFLSKEIPGVKEFVQSRIGSHYVSFRVQFQGDEEKFASLVMYHDALPVPIQSVEKKEGQVVFVVSSKSGQ